MRKLKAILGYTIAALAVPVILVALIGMETWSRAIVEATGIIISPWISGGEVQRTIEHGTYRTRIRRPVFDALIGQRREGFVQIDWEPLAALPEAIEEEIDYDGDGRSDFRVTLDTGSGRAALLEKSGRVLNLIGAYRLEKMDSFSVRVGLTKTINPGEP